MLDVGCGEGQLARRAASLGAAVTGVDPSDAQVGTARAHGGGPAYTRASATALPFGAGRFDAVVACLVLEHVAGYREVVAEVARVLDGGGAFLLFLNHPLLQTPGSGWIDDHILGEQYWRVGPYLLENLVGEEVAPGVVLPFAHRPLHAYVNTLAACGLLVTHMEEPAPPPGFLARAPEYHDAASIPRLLFMRAERRPPGGRG